MTDVKFEQRWSNKQLQKLLDADHIRQHLIEVGLINRFGEIVPKEEYERLHKRRSRRSTSSKIVDRQTFTYRPSIIMESRKIHSRINPNISISPSKQRNKSPQYLSTPNQSNRAKCISVQRTSHSPIISNDHHRCVVTMIYYGPQTLIDYTRSWFESEGDDIVVMQQHCGGENIIVYKGPLKSNDIFRFESRRHSDYPFALAFYINGLIDNRLSICCESRYKQNVRIGGKRGSFGIINVEKSRACRRCRYEQRMKRLEELKTKKLLPRMYEISTPEPNITRSNSPDVTPRLKEQSNQPIINEERSKIHGIASGVDVSRENINPSTISNITKLHRRLSIEKDKENGTRMQTFQLYRNFATSTTDIN